jgi:hypothetical protein
VLLTVYRVVFGGVNSLQSRLAVFGGVNSLRSQLANQDCREFMPPVHSTQSTYSIRNIKRIVPDNATEDRHQFLFVVVR